MRILRQILIEFWIPLSLSTIWVLYNVYAPDSKTSPTLLNFVNIFGPAFFLSSWILGQFFRIRKQSRVEDSFGSMEKRFVELLDRLEQQAQETVAHITGGTSFARFEIFQIDATTNIGTLMVIHEGDHPIYDLGARIVDLQKFATIAPNFSIATMSLTDKNITMGNLMPKHVTLIGQWKLDHDPEQSYNIFMTARNGNFTQQLRLMKISGVWLSASRVSNRDGETVHEQVDANYPREPDGSVKWQ